MEDMDDDVSSPGDEPLIIKETGDPDRSGLTITETQLYPSALMKPYLQEMDDLLKSCEELTGIPFGSRFSESFTDMSLRESSHSRATESYRETSESPQAYLSTSYIDTHMDGCQTEDEPAQGPLPSMGSITSRCGLITGVAGQREMPVSSTGNKLSEAMVEYEGQLRGMLAMLEGCMEETGMDFEQQDWAIDSSQDYVHVRKNTHLNRGTTLVPPQHETPVKMETQPVQLVSQAAQPAEDDDEVSKDRRNGVIAGSASNTSQHDLLHCCDNKSGVMVESPGRAENTEQGSPDPQVGTVAPSEPLHSHDTMYVEETKTRYTFNESTGTKRDMSGAEVDDSEMPADMRSGIGEFEEVASRMEECIREVQHLEERRKELLAEVLKLRGSNREEAEGSKEEEGSPEEQVDRKVGELMDILKCEAEGRREERKKEIQGLREDRAEEEKRMWKVNVERLGLQEELRKLKRRLFTMTRDSMLSQSCLNNQQREVELLKRDEEKLQSMVLQLTEERCQLRSAQQQQLLDLQAELHVQTSSQTSNSQEELSECRRHSCGDIQQYVQGGLRALEDRYEPILLALLKRRDATGEALVKAKEQAEELRAQLRPLRDEIQKLKLQRACLEEKLKLVHIHRREDVGQYKETVSCLEESSRELKTELKIQKKKTTAMEELRDSLSKQLLLYRTALHGLIRARWLEEQTVGDSHKLREVPVQCNLTSAPQQETMMSLRKSLLKVNFQVKCLREANKALEETMELLQNELSQKRLQLTLKLQQTKIRLERETNKRLDWTKARVDCLSLLTEHTEALKKREARWKAKLEAMEVRLQKELAERDRFWISKLDSLNRKAAERWQKMEEEWKRKESESMMQKCFHNNQLQLKLLRSVCP